MNFINIVYGVLSEGLLSNNFVLKKKSSTIMKNINYNKKNVMKIKKISNICKKFDYTLEEFMYSLINYQRYVDIILFGVSSVEYFKTLNFKKILNKQNFLDNLNKMTKYEEIKGIL